MISVTILEENDTILPSDWIRPLHFPSNNYSDPNPPDSFSTYSGKPLNNIRWVKVKDLLGIYWYGKTIKELNYNSFKIGTNHLLKYEIIRGNIPISHTWQNWKQQRKDHFNL